jgi:hypothetical protein
VTDDTGDETTIRQLTVFVADIAKLEGSVLNFFDSTISSRLPGSVSTLDEPVDDDLLPRGSFSRDDLPLTHPICL